MGRETILNTKTARVIYRALICGQTESGAARMVKISPHTLGQWKSRGIKHLLTCEFDSFEECKTMHEVEADFAALHKNMQKAIEMATGESVKNIRRIGKKEWTANAWYLERRHHNEWGKKDSLAISGVLDSTVNVKVELVNIDSKQRLAIAKAIEQRAKLQLNSASETNTESETVEAELIPLDTGS